MKKRIIFFLYSLFLLGTAPSSHASSSHLALGLSSAVGAKGDTDWMWTPEFVGYTYLQLVGQLFLRPGIRVGYSWQQPEMPKAVQVQEYDLKSGIEIGILWDWGLIPSFTVGGGMLYRQVQLTASGPVKITEDLVSGASYLPYFQTQLGLGVPIEKGLVVIEPYARYTRVLGDPRINWAWGVEATLNLF